MLISAVSLIIGDTLDALSLMKLFGENEDMNNKSDTYGHGKAFVWTCSAREKKFIL